MSATPANGEAQRPLLQRNSGEVMAGGKAVRWHETNGEIFFSGNGLPPRTTLGDLKLNEQEELKLVNRLLAHYRKQAIPDGNGYHASSAGVTTDGHLFLDYCNQIHIVNQFAGRGCAETAMLRKAQHTLGDPDVQFRAVYLMSGIATKEENGTLREREPGHIGCPCGECRQNLRRHTKDARFIMVPTNDGSAALAITNGSASPASGVTAWKIGYEQMYPLPEHAYPEHLDPQTLRDGYRYATDPAIPQKGMKTHLERVMQTAPRDEHSITVPLEEFMKLKHHYEHAGLAIPALEENPSAENINRALLQLIKTAYSYHNDKVDDEHNIDITAILLRTAKGEFFPGVLVNGDLWLPSKPAEIPVALTNAYNQTGITEVYMMNLNDRQAREEISAHSAPSVKMPDPAGLNRLIKNIGVSDRPGITIIPLNDGSLKNEDIERIAVRHDVMEAFGPGYANPKRLRQQAPSSRQ